MAKAIKEKMIRNTGNRQPIHWSSLYPANTPKPSVAIIWKANPTYRKRRFRLFGFLEDGFSMFLVISRLLIVHVATAIELSRRLHFKMSGVYIALY
ncbi:hypothetical protein QFZ51_001880 [Chitinophaga sp. W3I9]